MPLSPRHHNVKALTVARIGKLSLGKEHRDPGMPGLYLHTKHTGRHVWLIRYRRPHTGINGKLVLGVYVDDEDDVQLEVGGFLTPNAARELAAKQKRMLMLKRDPAAERKAAKAEAKQSRANTFPAVAESFILKYSKLRNRKWRVTAREIGFTVRKDDTLDTTPRKGSLAARWKDIPITEIKKKDVVAYLDEIMARGTPYVAINRHSLLAKMMNWAVSRDLIAISPLYGLGKPAVPQSRDRVLTDKELRILWRCAAQISEPWGACIRLLILTGCRRDECRCAPYDEFVGPVWTIPAARTKNGREHLLDLPKLALAQVGVRTRSRWVFTARYRHPINSMGRFKRLTDDLMRKELGDEYRHWCIHDLRRTFASGLARLGIMPHIIERALNHASGQISGVAAVYNRHPYREDVAAALEKWSAEVLRIVDPELAENPLTQRRYVAKLEEASPAL
ncbi:tyrosine-type recombinase/integrase [Leptospira interrogans]